jgi:hypothetical protein
MNNLAQRFPQTHCSLSSDRDTNTGKETYTWLGIPTASQGDGSAHVLLSHDSQTIY